jgi:predicted cupin superfamily sugar epimerase
MNLSVNEWISRLGLTPHPEGGFFREIYRAEGVVSQPNLPFRYSGGRAYSTAIYYLLRSGEFSSLHRLDSDEQWFHIDGSALTIHSIAQDGTYTQQHIGKDLSLGQFPHAVVHHGVWFGGTVDEEDSYSLVGCVVAPGFDFDDFELANREELLKVFPQHEALIRRLTR